MPVSAIRIQLFDPLPGQSDSPSDLLIALQVDVLENGSKLTPTKLSPPSLRQAQEFKLQAAARRAPTSTST